MAGELEERNRSIFAEFRAGRSRGNIASKYGVSPQRISQIIAKFASGVSDDDARGVERAVLEAARDELLKNVVYGKPRITISPTGEPVYDENGDPIYDWRDWIAAVDGVRKLSDSIRRLDALDLPRRVAMEEDEAMRRVKEYLANLPQAEVIEGETYPHGEVAD